METKLVLNLQSGILEVTGEEKFVKEIYYDFKENFKAVKTIKIETESDEKAMNLETKKIDKSQKQKVGNSSVSEKSTVKSKASKKSSEIPHLVTDLNLKPKEKESLIDFYNKFEATSGFDRNLIFVYYLTKINSVDSITVHHIYTCYKDVKEKFPNNLVQSLRDTKNRKGWIDTADTNNIKLTTTGENFLEHDLQKKAKES